MLKKEVDFIIVGAGSAGCVLADKLSADGKRQVILIEAGPSDNRFWIRTPIGYGITYTDPKVNWCYSAEPDPAIANRQLFWPRGKVLGGSSSINAMVYHARRQTMMIGEELEIRDGVTVTSYRSTRASRSSLRHLAHGDRQARTLNRAIG